jgi:hypothetical protein
MQTFARPLHYSWLAVATLACTILCCKWLRPSVVLIVHTRGTEVRAASLLSKTIALTFTNPEWD